MQRQLCPPDVRLSSLRDGAPCALLDALCVRHDLRFERRELLRACLALGEVVGGELTVRTTRGELADVLGCHRSTAGRRVREVRALGLPWLTLSAGPRGIRIIIRLDAAASFFVSEASVGVTTADAQRDHSACMADAQRDHSVRMVDAQRDHSVTTADASSRVSAHAPAIPTLTTPTPTTPSRACAPKPEPPERIGGDEAPEALVDELVGVLAGHDVERAQLVRVALALLAYTGSVEAAAACARHTAARLARRGYGADDTGLYLAALACEDDARRWRRACADRPRRAPVKAARASVGHAPGHRGGAADSTPRVVLNAAQLALMRAHGLSVEGVVA